MPKGVEHEQLRDQMVKDLHVRPYRMPKGVEH